MSIIQTGTVAFTLGSEHSNWSTNAAGYNFGVFEAQHMKFGSVKHPNQMLELTINGPLSTNQAVMLRIPPCKESGLRVLITWGDAQIKIYLNGEIAHTISV